MGCFEDYLNGLLHRGYVQVVVSACSVSEGGGEGLLCSIETSVGGGIVGGDSIPIIY